MQIQVRQATSSDASAIAQFNINMAMETEGLQLEKKKIAAGVLGMIEHPERGFYLVVEAEKEIVASLMITMEWSDWRNAMFWWIQSVYVVPDWRRQGLYRQMYQEVKRLSENAGGVCGYRLYVEKENGAAQSTYASLGMHQTHYLMFEETTN
ncbi:MAG: GNAT family N-acetyltransferase [Acidiferrobacterales bacterium]|nr:GNAT family N-acetyltransferase [Acidiferrobacterales bacterium]